MEEEFVTARVLLSIYELYSVRRVTFDRNQETGNGSKGGTHTRGIEDGFRSQVQSFNKRPTKTIQLGRTRLWTDLYR